jgi:hypothetical protein
MLAGEFRLDLSCDAPRTALCHAGDLTGEARAKSPSEFSDRSLLIFRGGPLDAV